MDELLALIGAESFTSAERRRLRRMIEALIIVLDELVKAVEE